MDETISVRLPKEELKGIDFILEYEKSSKSHLLREVLEKGIKEKRLEIAIRKFQNNEATASKAAKIAGIPFTSFLDMLHKRDISFHYNMEDLKEDIQGLV